jgi:small subunit ribosomal protein S21
MRPDAGNSPYDEFHSRFSGLLASRNGIANICRGRIATRCYEYSYTGLGHFGLVPINRLDRKGNHVQVLVRDNNVDQALKVLKKKMQREGVFREMKLRKHYEKPSERKTREKAEAIRRARKLARKKAQREGLLPMKPRVQSGTGGGGGFARTPRF